jgi:hypothetical protein
MGLIKWSKLPILGSALLAGYAIKAVTSSTGVGETPVILKTKAYLKSLKVQESLSSKKKSAQKVLVGGLRLTSDLLNLSADFISPESTWTRANKHLKKK